MHYHQYYQTDVINGPGTRATLFVSGCEHQCRGCYNQSTWNACSGHKFDQHMVQTIIDDLNDPRIYRRGLSLSGGDPLFPGNLPAILALVQQVKQHCPDKDIWLWTGYLIAQLTPEQQAIVDLVNVVVDGKFEQKLADPSLVFRGSHNQVIHYLR